MKDNRITVYRGKFRAGPRQVIGVVELLGDGGRFVLFCADGSR